MGEQAKMLSLHLRTAAPTSSTDESNFAERRMVWLSKLEEVLRPVIGVEARSWLCSDIATFTLPHHIREASLMGLLRRTTTRTGDNNQLMAKQTIRMLIENRPRKVACLIGKDSKLLCRFFSGQHARILQWFEHFAGAGGTDHKLGARALTRYAFRHREKCWHELEWKGKHSQAPGTVAAKPHYFAELDVIGSVENFIENVPSFWFSEELMDSLQDGQFLYLDVDFFIEEILNKMLVENSADVWEIVRDYLASESFTLLCQRTLHVVSDGDLLHYVNGLGNSLVVWSRDTISKRGMNDQGGTGRLRWLEEVTSLGVQWETLGDVSFCNACARHGRELFRILKEDEHEEEANNLKFLLSVQNEDEESAHWALRRYSLSLRKWVAMKWLALEACVLYYFFSLHSTTAESLETVMAENGVGYLRHDMGTPEEHYFRVTPAEKGGGKVKEKKRKKRQKGRKGRHNRPCHSEDSEASSATDVSEPQASRNLGDTLWRLSLDNYVLTWTKADLAEHLSSYALTGWLRWVSDSW